MTGWFVLVAGILLITVLAMSLVRRRPDTIPGQQRSAYEEADLVRAGKLTHDEALKHIAARYPDLSRSEAAELLARGLSESR